jgi:hypothetical protein
MIVNLKLSPDAEERLYLKARQRGLGLDAYLLDLTQRDTASESAPTDLTNEAHADAIWLDMISEDSGNSRRDAAIIALAQSTDAVRSIVRRRSIEAAATYYASPAGQAEQEEMGDWQALDGEAFLDSDDNVDD